MEHFSERLLSLRTALREMNHLLLLDRDLIGKFGIFDMDPAKIVISTERTNLTGADLDGILRERYHLEMEMCGADHVVGITSLGDREDGFQRLERCV